MLAALVIGSIGLTLSTWIGKSILSLNYLDVFLLVIISNLAAFTAILSTLWLERQPWMKKFPVPGTYKVPFLLASQYFGIVLCLAPVLRRDLTTFATLALPLIISAVYCTIPFGPIQDYLVSRRQRLEKSNR